VIWLLAAGCWFRELAERTEKSREFLTTERTEETETIGVWRPKLTLFTLLAPW